MIRLLPGASLKFMESQEVSEMIMNLFSSYKPEDVSNAHLYMHILAKLHVVARGNATQVYAPNRDPFKKIFNV